MIQIYRFLTNLIYPIIILLIFFRKLKKKEDNKRFKEKIFLSNFNIKKDQKKKLIWFHAASIGEFKSILPIISRLNEERKDIEFLITTVTLSSGNLASEELKRFNNVQHRFFPVDVDFIIKNFIKMWKPMAIFLVDSEIWPNLITNANKFKIPLAILNARITSKSYKKWSLVLPVAKEIFKNFSLCLSSNKETEKHLHKLNAKNIFHVGNIKLINENVITKDEIGSIESLQSRKKYWCAISTHDEEEKFCLNVHLKLREKNQNISIIIAPRHLERVSKIKELSDQLKLRAQILSKDNTINEKSDVIIINSFGNLKKFIKFSKSAFVGKSLLSKFKDRGGQNPLDAVKVGCKIYHGPFVDNFSEIYKTLEINDISKEINNEGELINFLVKDFREDHKDINKYSSLIDKLSQKTLNDTMRYINKFLLNETYKT